MELKDIKKSNKEIQKYSNSWWEWDFWDWHAPSYNFSYVSRKGNNLKMEVKIKFMEPHMDACRNIYYSGDTIVNGGVHTYKIKDLEKYADFKALMKDIEWDLKIKADNARRAYKR